MTIAQAVQKQIRILDTIPDGWKELKGATTAPEGYVWIWNSKSLFGGEYEDALVKREAVISNEPVSASEGSVGEDE